MKKLIALLLVSLLGVTLLAGCGGGGKGNAGEPARTEPMSTAELLEVYEKLNEEGEGYKKLTYEEFRDTYMGGLEAEVFAEDEERITYMWRSSEDDLNNFSVIVYKSSGKCMLYAANNLW